MAGTENVWLPGWRVTSKPVTLASVDGSCQLTVAAALPAVALTEVGAGVGILSMVIAVTDPFNAAKALTWLSGSTYGRSYEHLLPLGLACLLVVPLVWLGHRRLDLLSVDEDQVSGDSSTTGAFAIQL